MDSQMKKLPILILILFLLFLFIGDAQSKTAQLTCHNESQTWPQSGKIYMGNKIMFYQIEFSKDGTVKIYQGQDKVPLIGMYDEKFIKNDSKTKNGFYRNLVINRVTGSFTDRYYVFHHGKEETAWIDRGNCEI